MSLINSCKTKVASIQNSYMLKKQRLNVVRAYNKLLKAEKLDSLVKNPNISKFEKQECILKEAMSESWMERLETVANDFLSKLKNVK